MRPPTVACQGEDTVVDCVVFGIIVFVDRCLGCTGPGNKGDPFIYGFSSPQVVDPYILLLCARRDWGHVPETLALG